MYTVILNQSIIDADQPNKNNRIYSESVLKQIVEDTKDKIILGGDGTNDSEFGAMILPTEASHQAQNFRYDTETKQLICDIVIFDTLKGNHLIGLLKTNSSTIRFTPSGVGLLLKDKDDINVVSDYHLISINYNPIPLYCERITNDTNTE